MARYYASMTNSRGNEVTAQSPGHAHIRGWSAGVDVVPDRQADTDTFVIFMTGGSSGRTPSRVIGTVTMTEDGPVFEPAEVNALIASRGQEDYDESRTCTFREDYEIYGAKTGTVTVSYSGNCRNCKTSVNFKYEHPFFPETS